MIQFLIKQEGLKKNHFKTNYSNIYIDGSSTLLYKLPNYNYYILYNFIDKYIIIINYDDIKLSKNNYRYVIKNNKKLINNKFYANEKYKINESYKIYIFDIKDIIDKLFTKTNNVLIKYLRKPILKIQHIIDYSITFSIIYEWKLPLSSITTKPDLKLLLYDMLITNLNNLLFILNNKEIIKDIKYTLASYNTSSLVLTNAYLNQIKTILKLYNKEDINNIENNIDTFDDIQKVKKLINTIKKIKQRKKINVNITIKGIKFTFINSKFKASAFGVHIYTNTALSYLKSINELNTLYIRLSKILFI